MVSPMAEKLSEKTCIPCRGGVPPLTLAQAKELLPQAQDWIIMDNTTRIERTFRFKNFKESISFVNKIGELAEKEGHHPDITFGWGYAKVSMQTHKIQGLHENDFIMAAKINRLAA
jgi:4a-hydroxytetrahydrobiopterin dehydratase